MNTTSRFFETTQQFLAFRNAFASAQHDKRVHKTIVEKTIPDYDPLTKTFTPRVIKVQQKGWLTSAHYVLYNLIAGRDFYSGFSPKIKRSCITNGLHPDNALIQSIGTLSFVITAAKKVIAKTPREIPSWIKDKHAYITQYIQRHQKTVDDFIAPFNGAITVEDIARLQIPKVPPYCDKFATPRSLEQLDKLEKPITYQKLLGQQIISQKISEQQDQQQVVPPVYPSAEKKSFLKRLFGV